MQHFLTELCTERAKNRFKNCVLFLLGPTEHAEKINASTPIRHEVLELPDIGEISVVAEAARQHINPTFDIADLQRKVEQINADVTDAPPDKQWHTAGLGLKKLRLELTE